MEYLNKNKLDNACLSVRLRRLLSLW